MLDHPLRTTHGKPGHRDTDSDPPTDLIHIMHAKVQTGQRDHDDHHESGYGHQPGPRMPGKKTPERRRQLGMPGGKSRTPFVNHDPQDLIRRSGHAQGVF